MNAMEEFEEIQSISTEFDIKVETLASNLLTQSEDLKNDFDIDQILVAPRGAEKRRTLPDVNSVTKKYFDNDTALLVQVNRKGFFDNLPKRLFLRLDEKYDTPKKRTKAITAQIKEARKFFLPFEQATYHPRIESERIEQKYTEEFPEFFERIWGLQYFKKVLNERQIFLLCHLLPEAYRAVGDWKLTGLIFEAVLQKPINFAYAAPMKLKIPNAKTSANEMRLGDDSVMGNEFKDEFPTLDITVKGVTSTDLENYLPGGKDRVILEDLLCGYFIPLDVPYRINIDVTEDGLGFDLGEMILGYNIYFN